MSEKKRGETKATRYSFREEKKPCLLTTSKTIRSGGMMRTGRFGRNRRIFSAAMAVGENVKTGRLRRYKSRIAIRDPSNRIDRINIITYNIPATRIIYFK